MKRDFAIVTVFVIFMCRKISFLFCCIRIVLLPTSLLLSLHLCVSVCVSDTYLKSVCSVIMLAVFILSLNGRFEFWLN